MTFENCPRCGQPLKTRSGKFGLFRGCTGFPACRYTDNHAEPQKLDRNRLYFPLRYVVVDLETTGLSPAKSEILEIAAVRFSVEFDGYSEQTVLVDRFVTFVHPKRTIPAAITALTGITNAMVKDAPSIETAFPAFMDYLGTDPIVGHNVSFDLGFLAVANGAPLNNFYVDTLRLARTILPERRENKRSNSLEQLAADFDLPHRGCHRAEADVLCTNDLFEQLHALAIERDMRFKDIRT